MAGPVRIAIIANGRQARAEIQGVAAAGDLMGRSFSRAGKLLAAGFAVDKLARGVGALVQTGGSYVETLNKVQAVTGANQRQIDAAGSTLEGQAKQYAKLGQTSGDAANGALELAKAGLTLKQSLQASYDTAVLAKAGQLEVADASTLVANTLNTYNLKATQAAEISNDLANAANISSADVSDLAESFKYVSPLAAKSGVSLAQTNAVLAELANSGIKASDAGTGFRKFLASLQAPTGKAAQAISGLGVDVYDAQGKMKPLGAVVDDLRGSLSKLTQEQQNKALRDIFGLTGVTSASIILKNGRKGLDEYTKGVERAGGAQTAAEAGSKGLLGTLRSLRAETITGADAFYRHYSPAVDAAIKADLPKVLAAAKSAGEQLLPTLSSLASTTVDLGRDVAEVAQGPIGQDFIGGLKLVVGLTKTASDALDSIPGPIRQIGIEAGIAALVMPRLTGGVTAATGAVSAQVLRLKALRAELVTTQAVLRTPTTGAVPSTFTGLVIPPSNAVAAQKYASSLQLVERQSLNTRAALSKLGNASRGAAGVGGLVLLTEGAKQSNEALSTLETTAGAAALGFSVGGPWGAAIGAAGALGTKLFQTGNKAEDAYAQMKADDPVKDATRSLSDLKGTLDQVSGAYTGATRAAVLQHLQQTGLVDSAAKYGISSRTLVNAALGQRSAFGSIAPVVQDYQSRLAALDKQMAAVQAAGTVTGIDRFGRSITATNESTKKQLTLLGNQRNALKSRLVELDKIAPTLRAGARETQAASAATADYAGKLKNIPPASRTKIEADGIVPTTRGVAQIAAQYRLLDKKQIKTLISASGAETTVRQVRKVIDTISGVAKTKVDVSGFARGVSSATKGAEQVASQGGAQVAKTLATSTGKARANLDPFRASVSKGASSAVGPALTGGVQVGSALSTGVTAGFAPTQSRLAASAAAAVRAAVAAARAAADAHSPSRKTFALGADMGQGLVNGLLAKRGEFASAATVLTAGLLGALSDQSPVAANMQTITDYATGQFDSALDASTKSIDRKYDQLQRVLDTRYKAATDRIKKNLDGKAQDKALDKAEKAHERLSNEIDRKRTASEKVANQARSKAQKKALEDTGAYRVQLAGVIQQQKDLSAAYDAQVQALSDLRQQATDYASGVRDAVTSTGSLSTIAQSGATSLTRILKDRAKAVAQAERFAADIAQLTAAGLNADDIKDLEAQGPGALKTADAIAKGGADAITQLNTLQSQLQTTGQNLGDATAQTLYGAGITAAQGLVDGLAAQESALAAVATTLGQQIAAGLAQGIASAQSQATKQAGAMADDVTKHVKKKFKSKSPSLVFDKIGVDVDRGLGQGIARATYATRQAGLLADRVTRRGTPALDAYLGSAASTSKDTSSGSEQRPVYGSLFGDVHMQQPDNFDLFAEKLAFKINTRG